MRFLLLSLALGSAAFTAAARAGSPPDPADLAASVPAFEHASAFAGYRGFEERPVESWRAINEAIAGSGDPHAGHGVHAGVAAPAPEADSHRNHHQHDMEGGRSR